MPGGEHGPRSQSEALVVMTKAMPSGRFSEDAYITPGRNDAPGSTFVMEGTPLFSISEQNSVATFGTVPDNETFQRRISTWHPGFLAGVANRDDEDNNVKTTTATSRAKRLCFSVDEMTISRLRRSKLLRDSSCTMTSAGYSSRVGNSDERSPQRVIPSKPAEPPYRPPERMKTPDGLPRWPGDSPPELIQGSQRSATNGTSMFQRLLQHCPRWVSPPRPQHRRASVWRPPISGHSTPRYATLETHPFAKAQTASPNQIPQPVGGRESRTADLTDRYIEHAERNPHSEDQSGCLYDASTHSEAACSSTAQPTLSPSQRALNAANGNAIPVTPERASKIAFTSQAGRSVRLPDPQQRLRSVRSELSTSVQPSEPASSARTAELLQQFPLPPDHGPRRSEKRHVLSLFPRPNGCHQPRSISNFLTGIAAKPALTPVVACELDSATVGMDVERVQREQQTSPSSHPGTDPSPNVLRTFSNSTTMSRYFSAASTTAGQCTDIPSHPSRGSVSDQHERAIANGAVRFVRTPLRPSSRCRRPNVHSDRGDDQGQQDENYSESNPLFGQTVESDQHGGVTTVVHVNELAERNPNDSFAFVPVTITSFGRMCPHKQARALMSTSMANSLTNLPISNLDGDSTACAPPSSGPATGPPPGPRPQPSMPETDVSHSHSNYHIRRIGRAKGTWRTRMNRTRCWRCALHDSGLKGWKKFRKLLEWTCFCRFKAYDEDEEDQEMERERQLGNQLNVLGSCG